jgi:hypothetical protein
MAATVTWTKELAMPEATYSAQLANQRKTREWEVCLSAPDATGPDIAVTGTGIPAVGAQYGTTALRVITLSARLKQPTTNRKLYVVTAEYGIVESSGGSPITTDPWDRSKTYSYDSVDYDYDLEQDFNPAGAVKVLNTAGDLYAAPIKARRINRLIVVQFAKKVADFSYASQAVFIDSINDGNFAINGETFAAFKLLCRAIKAQQQTWIASNGTETAYYDIVYEFEASSDSNGFKLQVVSKGFSQKVGGVLQEIVRGNRRLARPALLDVDGLVTTTPYIQTFYPHRVVNWGTSPF